MADMPRPRPPHLIYEPSRHGQPRWYVRLDNGSTKNGKRVRGRRVRIHGEYGSDEFKAAYRAAIGGVPLPTKKNEARPHSIKWLITQFRNSAPWKALGHNTRKQREQIFRHMEAYAGNDHISSLTQAAIVAGRDRRADRSEAAKSFMKAVRGLCAWAVEARYMSFDPSAGVKNPKSKKTGGFKIWEEAWVDKYYGRWPLGSKERVWIDVIMYSGLRRGDAVRYGRQHISGGKGLAGVRRGIGRIKVKKSGETVQATLPILDVLAETLEAGPIGDMTFIVGERGLPLTKESFGNYFRDACVAAGVSGRAHGLRKLAATRAANNRATVKELQALFGWVDIKMPQLYTEAADRELLGIEAIEKMLPRERENEKRSSMPAPEIPVRTRERKGKPKQ
jgi:integrase